MTIPQPPENLLPPLVEREYEYLIRREIKKGDRADKKLLAALEKKLEELRIFYKPGYVAKELRNE